MAKDPSERHSSTLSDVVSIERAPVERHEEPRSFWPEEVPFPVVMRAGYRTFWISQHDAERFRMRPWKRVTWGDPNYTDSKGQSLIPFSPGPNGTAVMSQDLTLYEMSESDALILDRTDPARKQHAALLAASKATLARVNAEGEALGVPRIVDPPIHEFQR